MSADGLDYIPWNFSSESLLANLSELPDSFMGEADLEMKSEVQGLVSSEDELERLHKQCNFDNVSNIQEHIDTLYSDMKTQEPFIDNCLPQYISVPNTSEEEGPYVFSVSLESQPKKVANPDWIYSEEQCKLYIKPMTPCPIKFSAKGVDKNGFIRATPVFKQPEYAKEIVRCCPNHTVMQSKRGNPASAHFVRCDSQEAQYEECPHTGRLSVRLPFALPIQGTAEDVNSHECFCFVCNNSCGGLNRRQLQVVFTLETCAGEVIGCRVIDVRVCACPGRDSKVEIDCPTRVGKRGKRKITAEVIKDISANQMALSCPGRTPEFQTGFNTKRKRVGHKDDMCTYNVKVCGFYNFVLLKRIATALELFSNVENKVTTLDSEEHVLQHNTSDINRIEEADSTIRRASITSESSTSTSTVSQAPESWPYVPSPGSSHPLDNTSIYQCYSMWRVTFGY